MMPSTKKSCGCPGGSCCMHGTEDMDVDPALKIDETLDRILSGHGRPGSKPAPLPEKIRTAIEALLTKKDEFDTHAMNRLATLLCAIEDLREAYRG